MPKILNCARLAAFFALLVPLCAAAQEASDTERETITEIARCMVEGLPDDWAAAHMVVELPSPGASTGSVRYLVARKDAGDKLESFTPCETDKPAKMLVDLRDKQPIDRQGWTSARLVFERDGTFRLNYGFPK